MRIQYLILCGCLFIASQLLAQVSGVDGKKYKTIKIGEQIWLAENLDVSHFANGDSILEARSNDEWIAAGKERKPAWCYYENSRELGKQYGKLYNWFAITDKRGLAPAGWKIPASSREEFKKMKKYLGAKDFMAKIAGKKIKAGKGWLSNNGTNNSGFNALPAGIRRENGKFEGLTILASWWCEDEGLLEHDVKGFPLSGSDEFLFDNHSFFPSRRGSLVACGMSIRCLKK